MQADDLTREQAAALKNKLRPMLAYLGKLKRRMVQRGFLSGDPLLDAVVDAENAVHALHVQVHYLSCGDVVGRASKTRFRCNVAKPAIEIRKIEFGSAAELRAPRPATEEPKL